MSDAIVPALTQTLSSNAFVNSFVDQLRVLRYRGLEQTCLCVNVPSPGTVTNSHGVDFGTACFVVDTHKFFNGIDSYSININVAGSYSSVPLFNDFAINTMKANNTCNDFGINTMEAKNGYLYFRFVGFKVHVLGLIKAASL
ncbi:hypothetical protein PC111_g21126 [Phytophthora cactorum]|nr:hypothetical protein PC111_g21126 [Phytophthora cactorum]